MVAELDKNFGYWRAGWSMHIAAFIENGSLGALRCGVITADPLAVVGLAFSGCAATVSIYDTTFTGDAGANTGNWHEGLNSAAAWNPGCVFVLENNHWGVSTRIEDVVKEPDFSKRAAGYGIPGVRVDGFDVLAVYDAATEAVARARAGGGPTLLVTESYRVDGHYAGEPEVYRGRAEVAEYRAKDPIARFRAHVVEADLLTEAELDAVDAETTALIEESIAFAKASPEPDPATAFDYIYA